MLCLIKGVHIGGIGGRGGGVILPFNFAKNHDIFPSIWHTYINSYNSMCKLLIKGCIFDQIKVKALLFMKKFSVMKKNVKIIKNAVSHVQNPPYAPQ